MQCEHISKPQLICFWTVLAKIPFEVKFCFLVAFQSVNTTFRRTATKRKVGAIWNLSVMLKILYFYGK